MRDRAATGLDDTQGIASPEIVKKYEKVGLWKALREPSTVGFVMFTGAAIPFFTMNQDVLGVQGMGYAPGFLGWAGPFLVAFGAVLLLRMKSISGDLPMRKPIQSGGFDRHLKGPDGRAQRSNGAFLVGYERDTNREVWLSVDELKQHSFGLGTTGSGKTEKALGVVANALSMGSGVLYLDAKADIDFYFKAIALARRYGREDDVRFLNFSNVSPNVGEHWHSNNMNFLYGLPKDEMANLLVSLISKMSGENKVFQDRAEGLLQALSAALCWLRDNRGWSLTISTIAAYLDLETLMRFALGEDLKGQRFELPPMLSNPILMYIGGLAGAKKSEIAAFAGQLGNRSQAGDQPAPVISNEMSKQHGFVAMQLTRTMQRLGADYAHIFNIRYGDIDLDDIILNRRIVIVQIPTLGKSDPEVEALAKIVIANISMTMSRALGSATAGSVESVVDARVTASPSPFTVVFDEAGTYLVKGLSKLYKQGRSLNIALFMYAQDMVALRVIDDKEADQVIGSANNVDIMRIQDAKNTGAFAIDTGDKINVGLVGSFERKAALTGGMSATDDRANRIEVRNRLTFADLSSQAIGESTLITYGRVIRYRTFYADPAASINRKKFHSLFVRRLVSWDRPTRDDLLLGVAPISDMSPKLRYGASKDIPGGPAEPANVSARSTGRSADGVFVPPVAMPMPVRERPAVPAAPIRELRCQVPSPANSRSDMPSIALPVKRVEVPPVGAVASIGEQTGQGRVGDFDIDKMIGRFLGEASERMTEISAAQHSAEILVASREIIPLIPELGKIIETVMPVAVLPRGPMDPACAIMGSLMTVAVRAMGRRNMGPPPYVPPDWLQPEIVVDDELGLPSPSMLPVPASDVDDDDADDGLLYGSEYQNYGSDDDGTEEEPAWRRPRGQSSARAASGGTGQSEAGGNAPAGEATVDISGQMIDLGPIQSDFVPPGQKPQHLGAESATRVASADSGDDHDDPLHAEIGDEGDDGFWMPAAPLDDGDLDPNNPWSATNATEQADDRGMPG